MRLATLLSAALLATAAQAHEFEDLPWLLRVESTYADEEAPGGRLKYVGYASVIKKGDRFFALTAAHLTQGEPLSLKVSRYTPAGFEDLILGRRLADNLHDLEVIEIRSTQGLVPLATWQEGSLRLEDRDLRSADGPWPRRSFIMLGRLAWMPKASVLSPPLTEAPTNSFGVGLEGTNEEIALPTNIHPGMSGLPVLGAAHSSSHGVDMIAGIVSSTSRGFRKAWISHARHLGVLVNALYSAQALPGLKHDIRWYSRGGVLFRHGKFFASERGVPVPEITVTEAVFERLGAGAAQRGSTGNGTRADGGNGTRADGGNGSALAPSLGEGMLVALPGETARQVVAFKAFVRPDLQHYLVPGDFSSFLWLRERMAYESNYNTTYVNWHDVSILVPGDRLASHMWESWKEIYVNGVHSSYHPGSYGGGWLGMRPNITIPFKLERIWPARTDTSQRDEAEVRIFYNDDPEGLEIRIDLGFDELRFKLQRFGALEGETLFRSEIEVRGRQTGKIYRIDLSTMLMTPPSVYRFGDTHRALDLQTDSAVVKFRIRSPDAEYLLYD